MYQCSKKLVTGKEHCHFDHSDFPAHSMFTFDVCWGSLGTSIFQLQVILDPDYLPDYLSISYMTMVLQMMFWSGHMTLPANAFGVQLVTGNIIFHTCYEVKVWTNKLG